MLGFIPYSKKEVSLFYDKKLLFLKLILFSFYFADFFDRADAHKNE